MAVFVDAFEYRNLQHNSVTWKLLKAQNAPFIIAILDFHFGEGISRLTVPEFFVSVSNEFERISHTIYMQLVNCDEGYQDTLEDIFAGVDQIEQSAPGRSFRGFYDLLRDIEASESLQDEIDTILPGIAGYRLVRV